MVIHRRIWRALRENIAQYMGSIVLIVLSCLLFTGMNLVGANLQRLAGAFEDQNIQEDASFTTDKPLQDLRALESEAGVLIEESRTFDYPLSEGKTLRIFSQNDRVNIPAILSGKGLSASGGILINPLFAAAQNYQIGETLTILDQPFTITGYMTLPNYLYPLQSPTDMMYSQQNFGIAVISKTDFNAFDQGSRFYSVRFNQVDPHPRAQSAQFRALLLSKGIGILQWMDVADNKRVSYVTLEVDTIATLSKVMPGGLMVLTSILICTVLGRMIRRESAIIGALYALGYRKREIARHYLIFPIIIALAGGILGTILGLWIVSPMLEFLVSTFSIPLTEIHYDPLMIVTGILLPIVILAGSSFFVISKALTHTPIELMKGDQDSSKVNFFERSLRLERLSFEMKFKIREQLRSLSRLAFLLAGCAIATMLLLYGFTIKSSLDYLSASSLTGTFHFQHEYQFNSLRSAQPPAGTEPFSADLFLPDPDSQRDFYVAGVLPDSTLLSFVDESGAPLRTDQVIITRPLANKLKVKPGETVNLVRKLDGRPFSLKIDRIADTYAGKYIFMPLAAYNATFELPEGSYLGLWSPGPLDIPQDQLYSQKSIDESIAALKESMAPIQSMIYGYSTVAFIIGLIVIYLVTSMIIEENKTSISLMKIFGYRRKEVNALILNSSTLFVVIGYAIGIPLILASIGGLLQSLDNSVDLTLPVRINPLYILIGLAVILLSHELSKRLSRKKVDAVPMSVALKAGME